jgi:hypothetical protein
MTVCRIMAEVLAAADADSKNDPPLDQDTADLVTAFWRPTGPCSPGSGASEMPTRQSRANPAARAAAGTTPTGTPATPRSAPPDGWARVPPMGLNRRFAVTWRPADGN